jgi:hypothetical protein
MEQMCTNERILFENLNNSILMQDQFGENNKEFNEINDLEQDKFNEINNLEQDEFNEINDLEQDKFNEINDLEQDEFNLGEINDLDLSEDEQNLNDHSSNKLELSFEPDASGYLDQFGFDSNFDIKDSLLNENSFGTGWNIQESPYGRVSMKNRDDLHMGTMQSSTQSKQHSIQDVDSTGFYNHQNSRQDDEHIRNIKNSTPSKEHSIQDVDSTGFYNHKPQNHNKFRNSLTDLEKLRSSHHDQEQINNQKTPINKSLDDTIFQLKEQLATQKDITLHLKEKHRIEIGNLMQMGLNEKEEILLKFRTKIGEETCRFKNELGLWKGRCAELEAAVEELGLWKGRCVELEADLEVKTLKIREVGERCAVLDQRCVELQADLEVKRRRDEVRENDCQALKRELEESKSVVGLATKERIVKLQEENLELDRYGRMKNKLCDQLKAENIQLNQDIGGKTRLADILMGEKADLEVLVERLKTNVAELDLKCEQSVSNAEVLDLKDENQRLYADLAELDQKSKQKSRGFESEIMKLKDEIQRLKTELDKENRKSVNDRVQIGNEIDSLQRELASAKDDAKHQERINIQEMSLYLDRLMKSLNPIVKIPTPFNKTTILDSVDLLVNHTQSQQVKITNLVRNHEETIIENQRHIESLFEDKKKHENTLTASQAQISKLKQIIQDSQKTTDEQIIVQITAYKKEITKLYNNSITQILSKTKLLTKKHEEKQSEMKSGFVKLKERYKQVLIEMKNEIIEERGGLVAKLEVEWKKRQASLEKVTREKLVGVSEHCKRNHKECRCCLLISNILV